MKIRNGFVSNSSSSSFVVYGLYVTGDKRNSKKLLEAVERLYEEGDSKFLEIYDDDGYFYIGMPMNIIEKMFPDIKVSEIKQEVAKTMSKELGVEISEKNIEYIDEVISS